MATILYEIWEDDSVDPPEYYVEFVSREELSLEDMCYLINTVESLITEATCRAVLMELQNVIADQLAIGNWILFDDFWLWQPELDDQLELPTEEPSYELAVACDIQSSVDDFVVDEGTFELLRYAFPVAPYITSCNDSKYLLPDHVVTGEGFVVYGDSFDVDPADSETGVWLKSAAGNDYQQDRFVSGSSTQITVVGTPTIEGAAGQNSVEQTLSVRSRYEDGGDIATGEYANKVRARNVINSTYKKAFLINNQSSSVVNCQMNYISTDADLILYAYINEAVLYIKSIYEGNESPEIPISSNKEYSIPVYGDLWFVIDVIDYTTLLQNVTDRQNQIIELLEVGIEFTAIATITPPYSFEGAAFPTGTRIAIRIIVPPGTTTLTITTVVAYSGGLIRMYASENEMPNTDTYDCMKLCVFPTPQQCIFSPPEEGYCYVLLETLASSASTGFSVIAV